MPLPPSADVVDVDLEDSPVKGAAGASGHELREAVLAAVAGRDLSTISLKELRRGAEAHLGMNIGGLDGRRDEVKAIAQELVQQRNVQTAAAPVATVVATATPPVAQAAQGPPAARRKSLLSSPGTLAHPGAPGGAGAGGVATDVITGGAKRSLAAPADVAGATGGDASSSASTKRRRGINAFQVFQNEQRASIIAELSTSGGDKVAFGAVTKLAAERWKALPEADKAQYAARAAAANAEQTLAAPMQAPARNKPKAKAKPKAGSAGGSAEAIMTRAEFLRDAEHMQIQFGRALDGAEQGATEAESSALSAPPRMFKSGSMGWFVSTKMKLLVGGREVSVQAQVNLTAHNSKCWEDGESLAEITAKLASVANASAGGKDASGPAGDSVSVGGSAAIPIDEADGVAKDVDPDPEVVEA